MLGRRSAAEGFSLGPAAHLEEGKEYDKEEEEDEEEEEEEEKGPPAMLLLRESGGLIR